MKSKNKEQKKNSQSSFIPVLPFSVAFVAVSHHQSVIFIYSHTSIRNNEKKKCGSLVPLRAPS